MQILVGDQQDDSQGLREDGAFAATDAAQLEGGVGGGAFQQADPHCGRAGRNRHWIFNGGGRSSRCGGFKYRNHVVDIHPLWVLLKNQFEKGKHRRFLISRRLSSYNRTQLIVQLNMKEYKRTDS